MNALTTLSNKPRLDDSWLVNVHGDPNKSYEISVLRDNNVHGKRSYGWADTNKIIISGSGGPCNYTVPPFVFDRLVKLAQEFARHLNSLEKAK